MPFRKRKSRKSSHAPLIETEGEHHASQNGRNMQEILRPTESQAVVDMLTKAQDCKLFHPTAGSRVIIPCKVKKISVTGKLTIEICPLMKEDLGIQRIRVRMMDIRKGMIRLSEMKSMIKETPLHFVSIGDFDKGRWNVVLWNWEPETPYPDRNPEYETSVNNKIRSLRD